MTAGAWLFMGVAWGAVSALVVYCFYKVLTTDSSEPE